MNQGSLGIHGGGGGPHGGAHPHGGGMPHGGTAPGRPHGHGFRRGAHVWGDGGWWDWDGSSWILITTTEPCGTWSEPLLDTTASPVFDFAKAELAASGGQPVTERLADGLLYLFTLEHGQAVVRRCQDETGATGAPPAPPTPSVVRPHPRGSKGVRRSAAEVAKRIWFDSRSDTPRGKKVITWTRQTIKAANLPDARGYPNADNVVGALFAGIKKEVAFVRDPVDAELIAGAVEILCLDPHGICLLGEDCDGQLTTLGSTTMSAGIPVKLKVRRYQGAAQGHVTMIYDASARGDGSGPWHDIDPSVEDGRVSDRPYLEEIIVDCNFKNPEAGTFIGLGDPDDGGDDDGLGDPPAPSLSAEETAGWIAMLGSAKVTLDRAVARLQANGVAFANVRADLGLPEFDPPAQVTPPSGGGETPTTTLSPIAQYVASHTWTADAKAQEQKILATAMFMSTVLADALSGKRAIYFNQGDLYVAAEPGDAYRVLMSPDANGVLVPTYFDNANQPAGTLGIAPIIIGVIVAAVTLAAVYAIAKVSDYLASAHHDDAIGKIAADQQAAIDSGKETPEQAAAHAKALTDLAGANQPPASSTLSQIATYVGVGLALVAGVAGLFLLTGFIEKMRPSGVTSRTIVVRPQPSVAEFGRLEAYEPRRRRGARSCRCGESRVLRNYRRAA